MANWGGLIGTILAGASGLAENLFGTNWEAEANAKEKALGDSPKFDTPQSQTEYENLMRSRAREDMPGYNDMLNQIEAQTAYQAGAGARVADSQYGAMAAGGAAQANRRRYLRQLGIQNQASKSDAELAAIQAGASGAQYDMMKYEYNDNIPWQVAKNEIASLRGFAQQGITNQLDTIGAAGIYGAQLWDNRTPQNNTPQSILPNNGGGNGQTGNIEPWMTQQWQ